MIGTAPSGMLFWMDLLKTDEDVSEKNEIAPEPEDAPAPEDEPKHGPGEELSDEEVQRALRDRMSGEA